MVAPRRVIALPTRCLERAAELGVIEALDDRPRAGRDPVITAEAKTWLVA